MSKIAMLSAMLDGAHVRGDDRLASYYAARAVRNAGRIRDVMTRLSTVRTAVKNYRVMVSLRGEFVRLYRPDTQQEFII